MSDGPVPLDVFLTKRMSDCCKDITPGRAFLYGAGAALGLAAGSELLRPGNVLERTKLAAFSAFRTLARLTPHLGNMLAAEVEKLSFRTLKTHEVNNTLPEKGLPHAEVMRRATALREALDEDFSTGHLSGTIYHGGSDLTKLINDTLVLFQWTNPLHMDTYPSVRQMESEIVAMCVALFHGRDAQACGGVTSGGTDSICMAIKAHREYQREKRGITRPNIVCPITVHPAFDKACHYYCIDKIDVPVDPSTGCVDPAELEKYVTENTICIVGSAINYAYGTVDDIQALSDIAQRHGCGLHVDACLGGFVLQFLEDAGVPNVPVIDFRIKGVNSISVDTHKFGFAPKGSSVVLFDSMELRRYMYFAIATWPGGVYASPGFNGSRPGNIIAGTWAAMMAHGKEGYVKSAKKVYDAMRAFCDGIRDIDGLFVIGQPQSSAVAFTSNEMDIYALGERVKARFGWNIHTLQFPSALQFSLTVVHSRPGIIEKFIADIKTVADEMRKENQALRAAGKKVPLAGEGSTMYGTQQRIADRSLISAVTKGYLDKYYQTSFPERKKKGEEGGEQAKKEGETHAVAAAAPAKA